MSEVDDRIVSMKFDNATFEQKLSATIASLDKLTATLAMTNATKGLQGVSSAAASFDMGGMGVKIEGVSSKFLALASVGITAIVNLTNRVVDAGLKMAKALSLKPMMDGFREYEVKMGSIQTILANTERAGTTLEEVTANLDELNEYADKTIYSFGDMTKNIGLFTNAGIGIKDATAMIQGFSNVAAASGTNAEGAAGAAYQLSQALSSGTVRLMDWRSLTNVGMGNKNMQNDIISIAGAMGELEKNGTSATEIQGNFNASLEKNWLSADVMSKYLQIMAGKMSDAEMATMGLTAAQIDGFHKAQKTAEEAATKVRTWTQLIGTIKEAMGSSWAESFNIIIGDFNEATELFTSINNAVGSFIKKTSDARNALLQGWSDMGGRTILINAFKDAFKALGQIVSAVKEAFTDVFPPATAQTLMNITVAFASFTNNLRMTHETQLKLKHVMGGLFKVFDILWEVVKGVGWVLLELIAPLRSATGGMGDLAVSAADWIDKIHGILIGQGKIREFFNNLRENIQKPIEFLKKLTSAISDFFKGPVEKGMDGAVDRVTGRFDALSSGMDRLKGFFDKIRGAFDKAWEYISTWFKELGNKIAAVLQPGDFDAALDVVNVGLLGGIGLLLKKFLSGGIKFNAGGLIDKITGSFDALTGTLGAMQAKLKAEALQKLAIAIGIMTASIVVLSMIDTEKLTKALTAIAISFGQLLGAMALLDKITANPAGPVKMAALSAMMISLATAMLVLSGAIKVLSSLSWEELAKGLAGVAVGMGLLVVATRLIAADTSGLVRAGIAMIGISVALRVLAEAVEAFSLMDWGEMAKGLAGVAVGLGLLTIAANKLPKGMVAQGAGIVLLAGGLRILAESVKAFGEMDLSTMAQGLAGVGVALGAIVGTMSVAPTNLPVTAAGILVLSGALFIMAEVVNKMGSMDFESMAKGIGGLGVTLGILVIAMNAMQGAIAGAAALVIVSGALVIMTKVLETLGNMKVSELVTALAALAGVFTVLGAAGLILSPIIPSLLGLGVALTLIGLGFTLFGAGVMMVGKAFEILAKSGKVGAKAIVDIIAVFLTARVKIVQALVGAIMDFAKELLESADVIIRVVGVFLGHVLDTIIKLAPKIAKTLATIITEGLRLIREKFPDFVEAGAELLLTFLGGIRDNIGEIVTVVSDIVTNFLDALSEKVPEIVNSAYNLLMTVIKELAFKLGEHATAFIPVGQAVIDGFITGLVTNVSNLIKFFTELPGKIIDIVKEALGIQSPSSVFSALGGDIMLGFLKGLVGAVVGVMEFFISIPIKILSWIGTLTRTLWTKGIDLVTGLLGGLGEMLLQLATWYLALPGKILGWMIGAIDWLFQTGKDILTGLWNGLKNVVDSVKDWFRNLTERFINSIPNPLGMLLDVGKKVIEGLLNGMKAGWDKATGWLEDLNPANWFNDINPYKGHARLNLAPIGEDIFKGLNVGMKDGWKDVGKWLSTLNPSEEVDGLEAAFAKINFNIPEIGDTSPVITPILDLTKVANSARDIDGLLRISSLNPSVSMSRAREIATTAELERERTGETPVYSGPAEVNFYQNNYSPEALSVNDIYRGTKSQIALAKEELGIS